MYVISLGSIMKLYMCIEVSKYFCFFEADEKSFHKFLPSNETQSSPHRREVSHELITLTLKGKRLYSKSCLQKSSLSSPKENP